MNRIPRRVFQEEVKREAIKLVNVQGLSIAEASKKLDTGWPKAIASKSLRCELHRYRFTFTAL
jgi:transposase-like protein